MREAYYEGNTVRIINEYKRVAYETTLEKPGQNDVFIRHDMSERHATSILELRETGQKLVPIWFRGIVNELN